MQNWLGPTDHSGRKFGSKLKNKSIERKRQSKKPSWDRHKQRFGKEYSHGSSRISEIYEKPESSLGLNFS